LQASRRWKTRSLPELFTAEGVRGEYLNELTRQSAGELAAAFAAWLWELQLAGALGRQVPIGQGVHKLPSRPVVVLAHDDRPSSPDLVTGAGAALRRMGCQVVDIGLATRPCFWFAIRHLQATAGIHMTGVGCDPAWNGLDFVGNHAIPCSEGGGLDQIARQLRQGVSRPLRRPGSQSTFRATLPYEAGLWKHFHALRPLRIALGCSSRPVRGLLSRLFQRLACRVIPVSIPIRARQMQQSTDADVQRVSRAVTAHAAHLGVLIDDDGQRCAFLDETGQLFSPARMTRLLANLELENHPAGAVVIGSSGGEPVDRQSAERVVPAGQLYDAPATLEGIAAVLQKHQGVLGSDDSGRYWFADPFPTSDAVLTLAKVLQALSRSDREFSKVA